MKFLPPVKLSLRSSLSTLTLASLFLSLPTYAAPSSSLRPSDPRFEYCERTSTPENTKEWISSYSGEMSFRNEGKIAFCWWHSRFHRAAAYLMSFRPDQKRLPWKKLKKRLKLLRKHKAVVEIPGFQNLKDFTRAHEEDLKDFLRSWRNGDGIFRLSWVKGARGATESSADWLQENMELLYNEVEKEGRITYQKLQLDGVEAHSWLVVDVKKVSYTKRSSQSIYHLKVIDSNYPGKIREVTVNPGDTQVYYPINKNDHVYPLMDYVPYWDGLKSLRDHYCQKR